MCIRDRGQDAHIDGDLTDAVNEGVRRGYEKAFLSLIHI